MSDSVKSLNGNAPDQHPFALLLVDVINPLDFPEADQLLRTALPAAKRLADLKRRARAAGVPVIYANDNFGRWRSDLNAVVEYCEGHGCKGRPLVDLLKPSQEDYFVLKPKHSAFFGTTLDTLLRYLGTEKVVIGGFAADICVVFTANDAYMRDLKIVVIEDGVASNEKPDCDAALKLMGRVLKAEIPKAVDVNFRVKADDKDDR